MTAVSEPLVSVITPVYNGAEHLVECIESVLAQTYENWECVVLDNCSADETLEVARSFEERDGRVRVISANLFVGAVENANRALREMSAESAYCKVLHADDWLFPECLERMVGLAEHNPNVGIVSAYRLEETKVTLTGLPHSISVLPGREIARSTLLGGPYPYLFGSPSSLLIRSDLIRKRESFYNVDNPFQDDQEACYEVLKESDFGFIHQVLTFTRRPATAPFSYFVRVGAEVPGQISLLHKFGPVYLAPQEFQRRLAHLLARYARYLVSRLPRLGDPDFVSYQRSALKSVLDRLQWNDVLTGLRLEARRRLTAN